MYLSKEAVDLIKSTAFYFGNPDIVSGELRKSKTYWIRAVNILNIISQANTNGNSHFSKHNSFRDSILNYSQLNSILSTLQSIGILNIVPNNFGADSYTINSKYRGKCEVELNEREIIVLESINSKASKRGNKATTDLPLFISLSKDKFEWLMIEEGKDLETIEEQWKIIEQINETGKLNPVKKRTGRLYSNFTKLSKVVHQFTTIDGKQICELDQHATYFTLLPSSLRTIYGFLSNEQEICLSNLSKFIKDNINIYEQISKETGLGIKEVKESTNSFICDPNEYMIDDAKIKIQYWFRNKFPHCSNLIDSARKNKRLVYKLMNIEADIFVYVSRKLKQMGIVAITKHDSILFYEKDLTAVREMLENRFVVKNIEHKIKLKTYEELKQDNMTAFNKNTNIAEKLKGKQGRETIVYGIPTKCSHDKPTKLRQKSDGRYTVSIKRISYYSKKSESKEQFKQRIECEFPDIIWS